MQRFGSTLVPTTRANKHGRTGLAQLILGSVTQQSHVPVLIVRVEDSPLGTQSQATPFTILEPLDGSPLAETVLPSVVLMARAFRGVVRLLNVIHSASANTSTDRRDMEVARAYLEGIQQRLEQQAVITQINVAMGEPAYQIMKVAQQDKQPSDVVAIVTNGRSGLDKFAMGSIAEQILHHLHRPVLLVHPADDVSTLG